MDQKKVSFSRWPWFENVNHLTCSFLVHISLLLNPSFSALGAPFKWFSGSVLLDYRASLRCPSVAICVASYHLSIWLHQVLICLFLKKKTGFCTQNNKRELDQVRHHEVYGTKKFVNQDAENCSLNHVWYCIDSSCSFWFCIVGNWHIICASFTFSCLY